MSILKGITLILIVAGLFAAAATNQSHMPSRDPCRKGILEICFETEGCTLSPQELYRLTNYRDTLAEICPTD